MDVFSTISIAIMVIFLVFIASKAHIMQNDKLDDNAKNH